MKQYGKWPACSAALETFFADPTTVGISSSLTFLHVRSGRDGRHPRRRDLLLRCGRLRHAIRPDDRAAERRVRPGHSGGEARARHSDTRAALEGAVTYAQTIQAAHPGDKVLIVLATDGYPAGCTKNTVPYVADAANVANVKDGIPVYVIGVGPDTASNSGIGNLNKVAEAGGTGSAFFLPTETDGGDASGDDPGVPLRGRAGHPEQAHLQVRHPAASRRPERSTTTRSTWSSPSPTPGRP